MKMPKEFTCTVNIKVDPISKLNKTRLRIVGVVLLLLNWLLKAKFIIHVR